MQNVTKCSFTSVSKRHAWTLPIPSTLEKLSNAFMTQSSTLSEKLVKKHRSLNIFDEAPESTTKVPLWTPFSKQENENFSEKLEDPTVEVFLFWFRWRNLLKQRFSSWPKGLQKVHCVTLQSACLCPVLLHRLHFLKNFSLENVLRNVLLLQFWKTMRHFQMHWMSMPQNSFLSFRVF